jgi:hypothetical protein
VKFWFQVGDVVRVLPEFREYDPNHGGAYVITQVHPDELFPYSATPVVYPEGWDLDRCLFLDDELTSA